MKQKNTPAQAVYTSALAAAQEDLFKYLQASCYLVVSFDGYWGRGDSVEAAARVCIQQGASRTVPASVLLILGDETAEVTAAGTIIRDTGSHNIQVLSRIRLGALIPKTEGLRQKS